MDKNIWLKVIRQELALLDELAIGMIEDKNLSQEEIELALARSKVVVREFEMLMNQHLVPASVTVTEPALPTSHPVTPVTPSPAEITHEPPAVLTVLPVTPPETPSIPEPINVVSPEIQVSKSTTHPVTLVTPSTVPGEEQNPLYREDPPEAGLQFKATPLKSIREGISLNDRFLFQRELFGNDKGILDETLVKLDQLSNIKEAVDFLKANFKWNKSQAAEKFVQLVKRRFTE